MAHMAVRHAPEYCEAVPGAILTLRDSAVVELAGRAGLGPPDLCWLRKTLKPPAGAAPLPHPPLPWLPLRILRHRMLLSTMHALPHEWSS